ncbi:hypothetical protein RN001_000311 [Aquatica leii]|uniref:Uncharacterized protein n=1 Tax=Aquatica leii TaxID=1421715 RepID=A0AAN7SSF2_9COLE|nr:hypothetical protein RN001_000311 [Aquatica leii]
MKNNIWLGYLIQIVVLVIFFLSLLACRTYCRKRKRRKVSQFIVDRINTFRGPPVSQSNPSIFIHCNCPMSAQSFPTTTTNLSESLPGVNVPHSAQTSTSIESGSHEQDQDQISLESHVIYDSNSNTAKTPPPPYCTDDLPTYEEAIRWINNENRTNTF